MGHDVDDDDDDVSRSRPRVPHHRHGPLSFNL